MKFTPPTSNPNRFTRDVSRFLSLMILMCYFRLCLAITCLILIDGPAYAGWLALEEHYQSHPLQTVYLDPHSVHGDGNVVGISVLIDWKAMQGGRTPTRFYSTTLTKQFDCVGKLVRTISSMDYYGHMGTGEVIGGGSAISEGHWAAVEPGTSTEGLWKAACEKGGSK